MTALGYPLVDVALVALVAGFCWAFGGMLGVGIYHLLAGIFRKG